MFLRVKITFYFVVLFIFITMFAGCKREVVVEEHEERTDILRIYVYESFANSAFLDHVTELFAEMYDCTVELVALNDDARLLGQIVAERDYLRADLVLGITNLELHRAIASNLFVPYEVASLRNVRDRNLIIDERFRLIPYDFAYFAFVYDNERIYDPPSTFGEFQSSVWHDRLIMLDPRTSATGHGLLMWIMGIYGERGYEVYWDRVRRNIYTVYNSHEQAYIDFLTDIAPMLFSYNTTLARLNETVRPGRYGAFIPLEGGFTEISYAGILEGAPNIFLARRFIDFMLTREIQTLLPVMHWRYPVISGIELPESFDELPVPQNNLTESIHARTALFSDIWIDTWIRIMGLE